MSEKKSTRRIAPHAQARMRILALVAALALAVGALAGCSLSGNLNQATQGSNSTTSSSQNAVAQNTGNQSAANQGSTKAAQGDPYAYVFRNKKLLNQHYNKHGRDMGFSSMEAYEEAASMAATNPNALHKTEKEDGDDVYYVESTNEFVIVSTDGYLRTYFCPDSGKRYYDKQ